MSHPLFDRELHEHRRCLTCHWVASSRGMLGVRGRYLVLFGRKKGRRRERRNEQDLALSILLYSVPSTDLGLLSWEGGPHAAALSLASGWCRVNVCCWWSWAPACLLGRGPFLACPLSWTRGSPASLPLAEYHLMYKPPPTMEVQAPSLQNPKDSEEQIKLKMDLFYKFSRAGAVLQGRHHPQRGPGPVQSSNTLRVGSLISYPESP